MKHITETLKKLIAENGIEILQQEQRLKAILADLHPSEKRLRYLLELSFKAEIPKKFIAIQNDGSYVGESQISWMKHYLKEEYFLEDPAIKSVFDCWENVLKREENTITDIDGNVYHSVKIGDQVWMVENLKTTRFNDGSAIPLVTENSEWENLSTPGYCWYGNYKSTYKNECGALYNWYTVNTGKLSPKGWHVPSDAEWTMLTDYLGGTSNAGGKLKESGTSHWLRPNTGATNENGFTALPGGCRNPDGLFYEIGNYGLWWSSTVHSVANALLRHIYYNNSFVSIYGTRVQHGISVRCLRDY